jgi:hypothetical protein
MKIARRRGERRRVRRQLADDSRRLLDAHRLEVAHAVQGCPLCRALAEPSAGSPG